VIGRESLGSMPDAARKRRTDERSSAHDFSWCAKVVAHRRLYPHSRSHCCEGASGTVIFDRNYVSDLTQLQFAEPNHNNPASRKFTIRSSSKFSGLGRAGHRPAIRGRVVIILTRPCALPRTARHLRRPRRPRYASGIS
jgi:hypothetical protein